MNLSRLDQAIDCPAAQASQGGGQLRRNQLGLSAATITPVVHLSVVTSDDQHSFGLDHQLGATSCYFSIPHLWLQSL